MSQHDSVFLSIRTILLLFGKCDIFYSHFKNSNLFLVLVLDRYGSWLSDRYFNSTDQKQNYTIFHKYKNQKHIFLTLYQMISTQILIWSTFHKFCNAVDICLQSMLLMDIFQSNLTSLALVWWYLRLSVGKGTQDFIKQNIN